MYVAYRTGISHGSVVRPTFLIGFHQDGRVSIYPLKPQWLICMPTPLITLVNKDFAPLGKMSVSGVFLDAEFKYFSRISPSPTPFALGLRAGIFCARTVVCFYRGHHEEFKDLFSQEGGVMFCNDVCSVIEVLGHEFNPDQWRLFIDSSKVRLKVVLLHNGNRFPIRPFGPHSQHEGKAVKA